MMKKLKEKKGFTLVELIVVLVILAILAALLVPALTGYIDKAKKKSIIAETRQVVMAAQTLVDEKYGTLDLGENASQKITFGDKNVSITYQEIKDLAEVSGTIVEIEIDKSGKVTKLVYTDGKMFCTYTSTATTTNTDGKYNVTDDEPTASSN